jgi:hypothetical protein
MSSHVTSPAAANRCFLGACYREAETYAGVLPTLRLGSLREYRAFSWSATDRRECRWGFALREWLTNRLTHAALD